jgi:hypothetical protein
MSDRTSKLTALLAVVLAFAGMSGCHDTTGNPGEVRAADARARTMPLPLPAGAVPSTQPAVAPATLKTALVRPPSHWSDVKYSPGNFTTEKGPLHTEAANQSAYRYTLIDKTMVLSVNLQSLSTSGAPSEIRIAIPAGHTAAGTSFGGAALVNNNGGWSISRYYANHNYPYIAVLPQAGGGTFPQCVHCVYINLTATFEVN